MKHVCRSGVEPPPIEQRDVDAWRRLPAALRQELVAAMAEVAAKLRSGKLPWASHWGGLHDREERAEAAIEAHPVAASIERKSWFRRVARAEVEASMDWCAWCSTVPTAGPQADLPLVAAPATTPEAPPPTAPRSQELPAPAPPPPATPRLAPWEPPPAKVLPTSDAAAALRKAREALLAKRR